MPTTLVMANQLEFLILSIRINYFSNKSFPSDIFQNVFSSFDQTSAYSESFFYIILFNFFTRSLKQFSEDFRAWMRILSIQLMNCSTCYVQLSLRVSSSSMASRIPAYPTCALYLRLSQNLANDFCREIYRPTYSSKKPIKFLRNSLMYFCFSQNLARKIVHKLERCRKLLPLFFIQSLILAMFIFFLSPQAAWNSTSFSSLILITSFPFVLTSSSKLASPSFGMELLLSSGLFCDSSCIFLKSIICNNLQQLSRFNINSKMLFVPYAEINRQEDPSFETFAKQIPFGFRILFYLSMLIMIINQILMGNQVFANIPSRTFELYELWRIFTAPLSTLDGMLGIASVLFGFWWMLSLLPRYETKYSTVHLLLEIAFQNFIFQIAYGVVSMILIKGGAVIQTYNDYLFTSGWFPIVILWIFKECSNYPNKEVNFCFLPCLIKNKYIGWISGLFFLVLSTQKTPIIVATLLGSFQSQLIERSIIIPPICLHKCLECCIPNCISHREHFIKVEDVEFRLKRMLEGTNASQTESELKSPTEEMNDMVEQKKYQVVPEQIDNTCQKMQKYNVE